MKIMIMTPSVREPKWGYIASVEMMEAHVRLYGVRCLNGSAPAHIERVVESQCSNLSQGRHNMLLAGINEGFDYAVMIDDDMRFPANILDWMFLRFSHPVVPAVKFIGVNAARKDPDQLKFTAVGLDGEIINGLEATGISKVRDCGLGFAIVDLKAIANMYGPFFEVVWDVERNGYIGEDRYFCRKLAQHGIDIYVDHDASRHIQHIGDFPYSGETMRHRYPKEIKE